MIRVQKAKTLSASCPHLRTAGHHIPLIAAVPVAAAGLRPLVPACAHVRRELRLQHLLKHPLHQIPHKLGLIQPSPLLLRSALPILLSSHDRLPPLSVCLDKKEGHGSLFFNPSKGCEPHPLLHKYRDTTWKSVESADFTQDSRLDFAVAL